MQDTKQIQYNQLSVQIISSATNMPEDTGPISSSQYISR